MYNFIDWLAVNKVREAYLSGGPAFVVSSDLERILWANGSGAGFLGAFLVGDLIGTPSHFDRAAKSQIEAGQISQRPVQLRGVKGRCSFMIVSVELNGETGWLAMSTPDPFSRYDRLPLLAGLSGEEAESAIVDADGEPLLASSGFDLAPELIKPKLQTLTIGDNSQGDIVENNARFVYGAARLDEKHFLVIAGVKQTQPQISRNNLNNEERSALREIAERLKNDMSAQWPHENGMPETEAGSLPASLHDLAALLDLATDGVIFLDRNLTIHSTTPAAEVLLQDQNRGFAGELLTAYLTPESVGRFIAYRADVDRHAFLNKGCVVDFNIDGHSHTVSVTLIRLETGGYAAILHEKGAKAQHKAAEKPATFADTAKENKAHSEFLPTQEKEGQDWSLLAGVAHEIRTPLNAMIGFAELMRDEKFGSIDNQRYREYLRDIVQSGHHILSLVNDLLVRLKAEGENGYLYPNIDHHIPAQEVALKPVSLGGVIRDTVSLMQEQANRDGIIVRISLETRLPDILANERAVRQIILNLLSNAIRFTPKGGQIVLSALRDEGKVILRIRDTGIGMNAEEIARAMRPYEQIKPENPRHDDASFTGTGLGLPLTKALAEESKASFTLTSKQGSGTVVEICFLRADKPEA